MLLACVGANRAGPTALVVGSRILSLTYFGLLRGPGLALGIAVDAVLLWLVWSGPGSQPPSAPPSSASLLYG